MSTENDSSQKPGLDARTFQRKLDELANTIAFKVQREGIYRGLSPVFVIPDIYFLLRQAQQTYNLFCFMNADERRQKDVDWRPAYSAVMLPLIRTMIDCLYNISAILQNPGVTGHRFRSSGYKFALEALDADEGRYGGDPLWDTYIADRRNTMSDGMRADGFADAEVRAAKKWDTLGAYLATDTPTPHQEFLKKFTFGFWKEYSGISHATFQGLLHIAIFLAPKDLPHEDRPKLELASENLIARHIPRVAELLLCTLTEVQSHCRFEGAHINQHLHKIWDALSVVAEIKELYDARYAGLMKEKGINAE